MANFGKLFYRGSRPYYLLESVEKLNNKKIPTEALFFASFTGLIFQREIREKNLNPMDREARADGRDGWRSFVADLWTT